MDFYTLDINLFTKLKKMLILYLRNEISPLKENINHVYLWETSRNHETKKKKHSCSPKFLT